jgi:glycosyltransferase involved in cell wall biosynthesis
VALRLLAVVIPAFRRRYLAETLESLAAQTSRHFRTYVVDDGSREALEEVVAPFAARLDLVYHRFPDNGGVNGVVKHWRRAIALTREPWVWLFSDDDSASPDCVEALLAAIARTPEPPALWRFDVEFVDAAGRRVRGDESFPAVLTGREYTRRLMARPRQACVIQNVVFSRRSYDAAGGWVEFPGGFGADSATWPRLARLGGVRRVPGGKVCYREHGAALSSQFCFSGDDRCGALRAYADIVRSWREAYPEAAVTAAWRRLELAWFCNRIRFQPRPLDETELAMLQAEAAALWPEWPLWRRAMLAGHHAIVRLRRWRWRRLWRPPWRR